MFDNVFGVQKISPVAVSDGNYIAVTAVDSKYRDTTTDGMTYLSVLAPCFELGGPVHPDNNGGEFYRLDASKKESYSLENRNLACCTAGATVRFRTDAASIKLRVKMRSAIVGMQHFANRGAYGFDFYTGTGSDRHYCGGQMQMFTNSDAFDDALTLPGGMQEVMVELPLYGGVASVEIGFPAGARICPPTPRDRKPIAFYGSSITQGGCASRPGNMYSNILCRALNCDCLNLGFSGSALGEQSVAEYLGTREISAFVMDYDYNSHSVESLQATHYDFYHTVRKAHPDVPFVLVAHPYYTAPTDLDNARKAIVRATYDKAVAEGDKKIYYVDSENYFPLEMRDLFAVDELHPNSLGQYFMAKALYPVLAKGLGVK